MVFGFLLIVGKSDVFAACGQNNPSRGCQNKNMVICQNDQRFCCDTQTECSARAFGQDCNPGSGGIPLGDCLLLSDSSKVKDVYTSPSFLVNLLVDNAFVAAGIVVFFMTLLAGFLFITGGKKGLDQGKQILLGVIVGLGLMLAAYWIVQIVKLLTKTDILI